MRPVIASGTCRSAIGHFFPLSLVTVPEVFANVNSFQFPSVSKVANEKTTSLRASSPGALAAGGEKEGELATTSLEFVYLHRKSRCEMLIDGDDISNDVIFNVCLHLRSFPLRTDWWNSDSFVEGEPQGNCKWNSNSGNIVASSPFFCRPAARVFQRACSQARKRRSSLLSVTCLLTKYGLVGKQ